ncbi:hypothetical protein BGX34_011337, partial [Mortierella sp. NVP85]
WPKRSQHDNLTIIFSHVFSDISPSLFKSNLETLATLSGSSDESWFYLVTTAIEAAGAPVLSKILRAIQLARDENVKDLIHELQSIRDIIEGLVAVLRRMFEKCDPYVFYWKVRPYLAGWENMAEAGLPNGVQYEGVDNGAYKKLAGGSAGQSSLIHALDVAFGVEHYPTGFRPNKPQVNGSQPQSNGDNSYNVGVNGAAKLAAPEASSSGSTNFIKKMRFYMPGPHRNFLTHLTEVANIRTFVTEKAEATAQDDRPVEVEKLIAAYDECIHQIKLFRDVHIQMVTLYIVMQANRGPSISHGGFAPPQVLKEKTDVANGHASSPATEKLDQANGTSEANGVPATVPKKGSSILYPQKIIFGAPHGLAKKQEQGNDVVRGTGGTDLIPFLRQSRDETNETKIVPTPAMSTRKRSFAGY